jgi:hypothetical protein
MSNLLVFPDDDRFLIVLLNQELGGWVRLGRDLAAILFGEEVVQPVRRGGFELDPADLSRYTGRYVSDDTAVEIVDEQGHLWLYTGGWPIGKYLAPQSPTEFAVPGDVGRIVFRANGDDLGEPGELYWDYGESGQTFLREPSDPD